MLELRGISKTFGPHSALSEVSLSIAAGEIHGLIGLNGSGKSTLLHILFGSSFIHETGGYNGSCFLDGKPFRFTSPAQAIAAGIGMVHQEFALIPEMTVAENILLSREKGFALTDTLFPRDFSLLDPRKNDHEARRALEYLDLKIDPRQKTGNLALNIRQFIEIAREISRDNLRLLLLDEPTAVLNTADAGNFLATLRHLADKGVAILFTSHRLPEIRGLCDRLTILREGRTVGCCDVRTASLGAITHLMLRESVTKAGRFRSRPTDDPILTIRDFQVAMAGEELLGLDLDVQRGEILGLISLSGHGKLAFGAGVIGQLPFRGSLQLDGATNPPSSSAAMIARGVFFLSEDRNRLGLLPRHSIMDNIAFSALQHDNRFLHPSLPRCLRLPDRRAIRRHGERCIREFDIRCTGPAQPVGELSGGNQQKVRIAHALTLSPRLMVVNEPTRGVDIAAKERILDMFLAINDRAGTTIVIASSELEELRRVCDRIAVLYQGRLHAILEPTADDLLFSRAISGKPVLH
ncbi:sugar ABC transporter ATP-binding protein [Desulfoprunum benzoelyticum]|uniref:Simple sugar transport system ATP-binding protein n=1 Tax=Desulfoprunum benzoelyticum TaxID=1506996 RepID=A0A840V1H3_9BACT|nr:sugar ABC transporter ATP-binding protein [Desulfoprunum benzoelyticum]MBB5347031.1 simple sugar transport system ATP-binding protein [Desulfoprunum benzoelyticum]MBM9529725.1 sugar ABC transporter ATP-binding protein [Desulfoprunum benzoelyticum]